MCIILNYLSLKCAHTIDIHQKIACLGCKSARKARYNLAMCLKINTFAMFFMVLDLRLTKVGTRRSPFFCAHRLSTQHFLMTLFSDFIIAIQ